jgi:hypothetical protein
MLAAKLASPVRELYKGQASPAKNLAYLSRSASTQPSSSKYGFRGADFSAPLGSEEIKGAKRSFGLTRGSSFRRQGSSGMTWADNCIFTDDGMFLGRHTKVSDDKGATSNSLKGIPQETSRQISGSSVKGPDTRAGLQRSRSTGSGAERKPKSKSGMLKWLKKNFRKAFR